MPITGALAYAVAFNGCGASTTSAKFPMTIGQNNLIGFREPVRIQAVTPESLRVIAGEVTLVTPDSVAFRMKGRPDKRVVFTFRLR